MTRDDMKLLNTIIVKANIDTARQMIGAMRKHCLILNCESIEPDFHAFICDKCYEQCKWMYFILVLKRHFVSKVGHPLL